MHILSHRAPSCSCIELPTTPAGACFSDDRRHRYLLWRIWDPSKPLAVVIMLNPSVADEDRLDPTLTRVFHFLRDWGYGGMLIMNAFSLVATNPKELRTAALRSATNDRHLSHISRLEVGLVAVGWGRNLREKWLRHRIPELRALLADVPLVAWRETKDGMPQHPLYLPAETMHAPYRIPAA